MPRFFALPSAIAAVFLALAGCQITPYRWGATEDTAWSGRVGTAKYSDVVAILGEPRDKVTLADGDTKARWLAETMTINPQPGSVNELSEQKLENRSLWRDMQFTHDGVLEAAWLSDQIRLANSTPP